MASERLCIRARPFASPLRTAGRRSWQRSASTRANAEDSASTRTDDQDNSFTSLSASVVSPEDAARFDPVGQSKLRPKGLPLSRYHYKSPRYQRGPLHPHQPPRKSDPASREFSPGPFMLPRMQQTYDTILSHDLMTILYEHVPPGTPKLPPQPRLREWGDESPYMKNRPARPPRGHPTGKLGLARRPITWGNVPRLERITVTARVPDAASDSAHMHAAGMVLQAMTGVRATVAAARKSTSSATATKVVYVQKRGKPISATCDLVGEDMWHFLSTLVAVAMPKIKDFTGVRGRAGDSNGNLQFGLDPDIVGGWPEVAVNFDAYPLEMIPGVGITLHSTARTDKDMRLLMAALGFPFKGNHSLRDR